MTRREGIIKSGAVGLFAIACIAFFQFFYPYHLFFKEQMQLFLFTSDYAVSYLNKPAALSCYLGDFLTQFFYLRLGGAIVIAMVLLSEWLIISYFLKKIKTEHNSLLLAFLPIVAEWVLHCGFTYSLSSSLSLIFALIALVVYMKLRNRWTSFAFAVLIQPFLYLLFGSGLFVFNFLVLIYEYSEKRKFRGYAFVLFMTGFIIPILFRSQFLLTSVQAYFYPHHEIAAFTPALLLILIGGSLLFESIRRFTSDVRIVPLSVVLLLAVLAGGIAVHADFKQEKILALDCESYFGNWDRVSQLADKIQIKTPIVSYYTNLFLAKDSVLPDHLLDYYQPAARGLFLPLGPKSTYMTLLCSNEVFYQLGDMDLAEQLSMKGINYSPYNRSSRLIRRLAEINLVNGELAAARKYLRMLVPTMYHRKWALEQMKYLKADTIPGDSWLAQKRKNIPVKDLLRSENDYPASLELLVQSNPGNKMALDYLLCYHLLNKNIPAFTESFDRYAKGRLSSLPRLYSEALLMRLISVKASEKELQQYKIPDEVVKDYRDFMRMYEQHNKQLSLLKERFGTSYWFYYHFAPKVKNDKILLSE